MFIILRSVEEDKPDKKWKKLFEKAWPYYRHWFLKEGFTARPRYLTAKEKLAFYMPELMPVYNQLCTLFGNSDIQARFLASWCPPAFMSGCSQIAWTKQHNNNFLIRNYDYSPKLYEGVFHKTHWLKKVMGMSDCIWGLLDGINEDGLVASLTFGGRKIVGQGFGIPLIIRYILETCSNVNQATIKLQEIPTHMSYNITLMDKTGNYKTLFLSPDRAPTVLDYPIGTNHQTVIDWEDYAKFSETRERMHFLESCYYSVTENKESLVRKFLQKPLYSQKFERSFGTLYTGVYHANNLTAEMHWPNKSIEQSFSKFISGKTEVSFGSNIYKKLTLP